MRPPDFKSLQTSPVRFRNMIGLMGTPLKSGNRGVLALGAALTKLCLGSLPGLHVKYFGSHSDEEPFQIRPNGEKYDLDIVHWRLSLKSKIRHHLIVIFLCSIVYRLLPTSSLRKVVSARIPWIHQLEQAIFVGDVRGGDSFSDIYGLKRFLIATAPVLTVLFVKGDLVLFPQTYGPFKSSLSRSIARWIIRRSSIVIARDTDSQRIAKELAKPEQEILLSPDVAFALHADDMNFAMFDDDYEGRTIPKNAIGINVNGLMFNGGYTGKNMFGLQLDYRLFLRSLTITLLSVHPGFVILVPHTYAAPGEVESDNESCRLLKESIPETLQSRVLVLTGEYDAHQLKGIIAKCDFFVGSRMHSCIAALSQGVPCVGVAYSMKFRGVFETVGMADWVVDARTVSTVDAVNEVLQRFQDRNNRRISLRTAAAKARDRLTSVFHDVIAGKLKILT